MLSYAFSTLLLSATKTGFMRDDNGIAAFFRLGSSALS